MTGSQLSLSLSLAVVLQGCLGAVPCAYGQLFEFLDDFSQPVWEQRDPWEERIETERHDFTQSAVLGVELSASNTLYAEWYGIFSNGLEDEFAVSVINMGIDHYVSDNFVLDVRAGVGLTEDSDDFFAGVGGGYRF